MYNAIVCKIEDITPIPGANTIAQGKVLGNNVVVGKDVVEGTLGVYFPTDGQLSDEFCTLNNLYPLYDASHTRIGGGFIDPKHRRIKTQRFMGVVSDGLWVGLELFNHPEYAVMESTFIDGVQFNELNGRAICSKYITKATRVAGASGSKALKALREHVMLKMHVDTRQLPYELPHLRLPEVPMVYITEKLHGTSGRLANVLMKRPLTQLERFANWLGVKINDTEWRYLMGTRRTLIGSSLDGGFYGDDTFRYTAAEKLLGHLNKGEAVYFEIVGWSNHQRPIMNFVSTEKMGDKAFQKRYGNTMRYVYGCPQGEAAVYVYRITQSTVDGETLELTWNQVKARCQELGVPHVPELHVQYGYTVDELMNTAAELSKGESTLDPSHIREGVVVRFEVTGQWVVLKNKSDEFKIGEGIIKDDPEAVDMEEVEAEQEVQVPVESE